MKLEDLGEAIRLKRGVQGVRTAASEIGISPATLSRVENGHLPDLETFRRLCAWLDVNPGDLLGFQSSSVAQTQVHFKKEKTQHPDTLAALGEMIAKAQYALDNDLLGD